MTIWLSAIPAAGRAQVDYRQLELDVMREHNLARTKPWIYADHLRRLEALYEGKVFSRPGQVPWITQEGASAVEEAIRFLERQPALPPVIRSTGMSRGARDHVENRGPDAELGHVGSDGSRPWDRISRYGTWSGTTAENISYGPATGRDVVSQLIIDDGVPERGHRRNIFTRAFRVVGVACGPHAEYGVMCVVTYAEGYEEQPPLEGLTPRAAMSPARNDPPGASGGRRHESRPPWWTAPARRNPRTDRGEDRTAHVPSGG